jgi:outer membrane protein, heavy metal efflux system
MTSRWLIASSLALVRCVGTGIGGDLRNVESATHTQIATVEGDVDLETPREVRAVLERPLDADGAVRLALLSNRTLRATLREMGVPRGRLAQAALIPNPTVELEFLPERDTKLEVRVEYDVTGLVLAPIRANAAAPDLEAARYRAAGAVVETGMRARAAFFHALAAKKKLDVANRSLDALAVARDAARALFQAGSYKELDLATEEAEYEEARAEVAELELAAEDAREALVRTLGLHGAEGQLTLAGDFPALPEAVGDSADLENRAVRASFDLKARKSEIEGFARSAGYARAEGWIPDVAADVHFLEGSPASGPSDLIVSGGVRASVPIFDRKQGTAASLDAEARASLERYVGAAVDVRSRARTTYARIVTAHARAKQYQKVVVPARQRVTAQALLQYNAMQLGLFELLAAKRNELAAELSAVDATANFWAARASFDALVAGGGTNDGSP